MNAKTYKDFYFFIATMEVSVNNVNNEIKPTINMWRKRGLKKINKNKLPLWLLYMSCGFCAFVFELWLLYLSCGLCF